MKQPIQRLSDDVLVEYEDGVYCFEPEYLGKPVILDADALAAFDRYRKMVEENEAEAAGLRAHASLMG